MEVICVYSETGIIGLKEVEERKHSVSENEESLKDLLRKLKRIVKKQSTLSKTLCFLKLEFDSGLNINVFYDTYAHIDADILSIHYHFKNVTDTLECPYKKAPKRIMEIIETGADKIII